MRSRPGFAIPGKLCQPALKGYLFRINKDISEMGGTGSAFHQLCQDTVGLNLHCPSGYAMGNPNLNFLYERMGNLKKKVLNINFIFSMVLAVIHLV